MIWHNKSLAIAQNKMYICDEFRVLTAGFQLTGVNYDTVFAYSR
jgi:hypothetical protein